MLFELELKRAGKGAEGTDPSAFEWSTLTYERKNADGGYRQATLRWSGSLPDVLAKIARPGGASEAEAQIGACLTDFLQDLGVVGELALLLSAGARVHMLMRFHAAELYALPWELVRVNGRQLGTYDSLDLRYVLPGAQRKRAELHEGARVLFAWSEAGGELPHDGHRQAWRRALQQAGLRELDELPDAGLERLCAVLREASNAGEPVTILHVLAHGGRAGDEHVGLVLDDQTVDGLQLSRALTAYIDSLRLVVLCACRSADPGGLGTYLSSVTQELSKVGLESVVGVRVPLEHNNSIRMTRAMVGALVTNEPPGSLEQAVRAARARLFESGAPFEGLNLLRYAQPGGALDTRPVVFRPYRGLESFRPADARFFFGRSAELRELRTKLDALCDSQKPRLQIVEGASGSGKSSLVLGGLVPELLEQGGWSWIRMVPGLEPRANLDAAIASVKAALESASAEHRVLLVVDQLEELFTHEQEHARETRDEFGQCLWEVANASDGLLRRVSVVCTMRTDYRARCGEVLIEEIEVGAQGVGGRFLDSLFNDGSHDVYVPRMPPERLVEVIEGPAHSVGLQLESGLAARLAADVGGEPGALPLLQFVMDKVWAEQHARADGVLRMADYEQLGGAVGALEKRANELMDAWAREEPARFGVARRLLVQLVSRGPEGALDTRKRVDIERLRPKHEAQRVHFEAVLDKLVDERLLVRTSSTKAQVDEGVTVRGSELGRAQVEVAHEELLRKWEKLRGWIAEDAEMLAAVAQVESWTREWLAKQRDLLGRTPLGYVQQIRSIWPDASFGEQALEFISKSERAEAKREAAEEEEIAAEQQRLEQRAVVQAVAALGLLALALYVGYAYVLASDAWYEAQLSSLGTEHATQKTTRADTQRRAQEERVRAESSMRLAGAAMIELPSSPTSATKTALAALDALTDETAAAGVAAHSALLAGLGKRRGVPLRGLSIDSVDALAVWGGSEPKVAVSNHSQTWLWSGHEGASVRLGEDGASALGFSRDGAILVSLVDTDDAGFIRRWRVTAPAEPPQREGPAGQQVTAGAFAMDSMKVLTTSRIGPPKLWDLAGGGAPPLTLEGHRHDTTGIPNLIHALALAPDASRMAVSHLGYISEWEPTRPSAPRTGYARVVSTGDEPIVVSSLVYRPNARALFGVDGDLLMWPQNRERGSAEVFETPGDSSLVVVDPQGLTLMVAGEDGAIRQEYPDHPELNDGLLVDGDGVELDALAISHDGRYIAYLPSSLGSEVVRLFDTEQPWAVPSHELVDPLLGKHALSPSGETLAIATKHELWVHDLSDSSSRSLPLSCPEGVAVSENGRLVACLDGSRLEVWSVADGRMQRRIKVPFRVGRSDPHRLGSLVLSPYGEFVALTTKGTRAESAEEAKQREQELAELDSPDHLAKIIQELGGDTLDDPGLPARAKEVIAVQRKALEKPAKRWEVWVWRTEGSSGVSPEWAARGRPGLSWTYSEQTVLTYGEGRMGGVAELLEFSDASGSLKSLAKDSGILGAVNRDQTQFVTGWVASLRVHGMTRVEGRLALDEERQIDLRLERDDWLTAVGVGEHYVAAGLSNGQVYLWPLGDLERAPVVFPALIDVWTNKPTPITKLIFSPRDRELLVVSKGHTMWRWPVGIAAARCLACRYLPDPVEPNDPCAPCEFEQP